MSGVVVILTPFVVVSGRDGEKLCWQDAVVLGVAQWREGRDQRKRQRQAHPKKHLPHLCEWGE